LRPQGNGGGLEADVPMSAIDNSSVLLDFRNKRACELFQIDVHPIDRKRFLTCGCDGTIRLFDMRLIHRGDSTERGFSVNPAYGRGVCKVTGAAFSDNGERIAASVIGGDIHVIDANQFIDLATLPPPVNQNSWVFDDDDDGGQQRPMSPATGEIVRLVGHRSERTIKTCNWFGDFVVTGSDCGDIYFYDVETAKIVKIMRGHQSPTNVVTVHREKRLLATSGVDDYATLWEPDSITKLSIAAVERENLEWQDENDRYGNQIMGCQVM
jgi:WD40 repeat protein